MIQLLEFYSLHLIMYPKLVSISSSIPSSTFLSHSYAVCYNSFLVPKYLYAFLGSSSLMSFSNVLPVCILLWTQPLQFHVLHIHNQLCSARLLMEWALCKRVMAIESPLRIWMGCDCITSCFVLKKAFFPFLHRYMGHFINNAQVGKTAEWIMQSQWKLCQLQLKTWGSTTCVRYFPNVRHFELTSVRHGVCRRLGYCDGWR